MRLLTPADLLRRRTILAASCRSSRCPSLSRSNGPTDRSPSAALRAVTVPRDERNRGPLASLPGRPGDLVAALAVQVVNVGVANFRDTKAVRHEQAGERRVARARVVSGAEERSRVSSVEPKPRGLVGDARTLGPLNRRSGEVPLRPCVAEAAKVGPVQEP